MCIVCDKFGESNVPCDLPLWLSCQVGPCWLDRPDMERLEQFFVANDVTGDDKVAKRRATFLSVVGHDAYNLLRSLIAPEKPTEKTFEQLVAVLTEHYSPKPTEVMQRFRFNSRARKEGKPVAEYVAELRKLTEFCKYGVALNFGTGSYGV